MDIILIFPGFIIAVLVVLLYECEIAKMRKEPRNKVHFYVARNMNGTLLLYFGKPYRDGSVFKVSKSQLIFYTGSNLSRFGLNDEDYANLKWEDEPVEVFLNLED